MRGHIIERVQRLQRIHDRERFLPERVIGIYGIQRGAHLRGRARVAAQVEVRDRAQSRDRHRAVQAALRTAAHPHRAQG